MRIYTHAYVRTHTHAHIQRHTYARTRIWSCVTRDDQQEACWRLVCKGTKRSHLPRCARIWRTLQTRCVDWRAVASASCCVMRALLGWRVVPLCRLMCCLCVSARVSMHVSICVCVCDMGSVRACVYCMHVCLFVCVYVCYESRPGLGCCRAVQCRWGWCLCVWMNIEIVA